MRASEGVRFDPPQVTETQGLVELLRLAFAGVPPDTPRAWPALAPLDLDVRLPGTPFAAGRRAAAASHLRLQAFAEDLARMAAEAQVPVVFLKFAALALTSRVGVGRRNACDIDVLVPASAQGRLESALSRAGIARRPEYLKAGEQHTAPLFHPSGLMLEIHDRLLGVRLEGDRRSVRYEDLERSGNLVALPHAKGAFVLSDEMLVAHLLVHGIAQHGLLPTEYPMLRMIGDLIDLGVPGWSSDRRARVQKLVAANVSDAEVAAAVGLARRLSAGDVSMLRDESGEGVLLRHIVAGTVDPNYRNGLKLRAARTSLTDGSRFWAFLKAVPEALLLSNSEIEVIYGRPKGPAGYLARRFLRPFDLVYRSVLYAARRPTRQSAAVARAAPSAEGGGKRDMRQSGDDPRD